MDHTRLGYLCLNDDRLELTILTADKSYQKRAPQFRKEVVEVGSVFSELFKEIEEVEQVFEVWNSGEGLIKVLWSTATRIKHEARGEGRAYHAVIMPKTKHHIIRRNDHWQWNMTFYFVADNRIGNRNEIRFIHFEI